MEESEEEPETDYRLPELVDYFGKKEVNKNNYQSMVNNLVKLCHSSFREQIQTGYTRVSPVLVILSRIVRNLRILPSRTSPNNKNSKSS